jgi:hypothetical protein
MTQILDRKLCPTERGMWRFDQAAPANAVAAVHVRGPLTEGHLRRGLAALKARHPYARARIAVDATGEPSFRFDAAAPLPLRVVDAPRSDLVAEFEREMNERFCSTDGPLTRCVLMRHAPEENTVILTGHHSILGAQGLTALKELLSAASGRPYALPPLDDVRSVAHRLPERLWSRKGLRFLGKFISEEVRLTAKYGAPFKVPRERHVPVHARRFRCAPRTLDAQKTARLTARAREERTTVHSALSAAMILGSLEDARASRPTRFSLVCPVDVRKALSPPVRSHDMGLYVSMIPYRAAVAPDAHFWDLARSVRDQLMTGYRRDALLMLDLLEGMSLLLRGNSTPPAAFAERWEKAVVSSMNLSNLGRLDLDVDLGPLSIESLDISAGLSVFADFGALTTTFRDTMAWTFVWADPLIGPARAQSLTAAIEARLDRALEEG